MQSKYFFLTLFLTIASLSLPQKIKANSAQNHSNLIAQSEEDDESDKCELSENWEYETPQSIAWNGTQYVQSSNPYNTTIKLQQTDTRQETIHEGSESRLVTISSVTLFNNDPNVDNSRALAAGRVGETINFLLSIPVENIEFSQGAVLQGKLSSDCSKIEGTATTAQASVPFTMTSLDTKHAEEEENTEENTGVINVTGGWVSVNIENGEFSYKHINQITQRSNQIDFVSGISGFSFSGEVSGQEITIKLSEYNPIVGTISEDGNRITSPDLIMIRLGSPGCETYEACQIP